MMRKKSPVGKCSAAFGVGLIVAFLCPAQLLVAIMAFILIVLGIFCFH